MAAEILIASPEHRAAVVDTVVAAFRDDPAFRHFFPDPATYATESAAFGRHLFDGRVDHDTIWMIAGAAAVAMWAPPGAGSTADDADEQPGRIAAELVAAGVSGPAAERIERYETMVESALPAGPHWYLGILATRPDQAGRRLGRRVMEVGLGRAAADGVPALLETTKPSNVELYRRSGWTVETEVAVEDLPIWVLSHPGRA